MNKNILIHCHNISKNVKEQFESQNMVEFNYSDSNFSNLDEYISKIIIKNLITRDFDIIYIKDNLSSNYLELYGLNVAYHIRLSQELDQQKRFAPIIILSDLDNSSLNKLEPMARISFTKNVYIEPNNLQTVKTYQNKVFTDLNQLNYKKNFLDLITIESPENSTNHSIANEWAIDQWSYFFGINDDSSIINNREKISYMLYYKFVKTKYELENKHENKNIKAKNYEGNLLLIDDKSEDGWNSIIKEFCKKYYSSVSFDYVKDIKKELTVEQLFTLIEVKINQFSPHVILLDLRLLESDNNLQDRKLERVSGLEILKRIKQINPSIQIIMFTASGDGMILDQLYKHDILGYVKKDAPTDQYRASKSSFSKLDSLIRLGLNRKYLTELWKLQEVILALPFLNELDDTKKELRKNIQIVFEVANSNISKPFTYSMLTIYKCIELLNDIHIIDDFKNAKWKDNNKLIDNYEDNSTKNYILNIIKYKTSLQILDFEDKLNELVCSRNYAIHTKEKNHCKNITVGEPIEKDVPKYFSTYILKWYEMLKTILEKIDERESK